eukprot:2720029-Pleurochrysis_carterae.AAC.2
MLQAGEARLCTLVRACARPRTRVHARTVCAVRPSARRRSSVEPARRWASNSGAAHKEKPIIDLGVLSCGAFTSRWSGDGI